MGMMFIFWGGILGTFEVCMKVLRRTFDWAIVYLVLNDW
jgi:hypothetical protein